MSTPKPTPAVAPLLTDARAAGLDITYRANRWVITGPDGHRPVFVPINAKEPRALTNLATRIRRMAEAKAAPATEPSEDFHMPPGWTTADLIAHARDQGVTLTVHGGLLKITAPTGAEGITATLHRHETAVIAALEEETMPPARPTPEQAPASEPDLTDPLTFLAHVQARLDKAEEIAKGWEEIAEGEMKAVDHERQLKEALVDQRDTADRRARYAEEQMRKAETRIAELEAALVNIEARADDVEAENRSLRARLDKVAPQLDELAAIKAGFRAALQGTA